MAENLNKIQGIENVGNDIQLPAFVKWDSGKGEYNYKIKADGNVKAKKVGAIDVEDVKNSPVTYYGKYVTNYTTLSDNGINEQVGKKWRILFADDTNIYLIASNSINKNYAPMNYNNNGDYCMYFTNILNLYDTSNSANPSVSSILGKLSKQDQYHNWLNNATLPNDDSQKAVLSMLDTDKWNEYMDGTTKKGFKNSDYASYVIGGPTIEMFCESYNKTHGGDDVYPKPKEDGENGNYYPNGYKIKRRDNLDLMANGLLLNTQTQLNSDANDMLFTTNGYWIASKSNKEPGAMMYVSTRYDGEVSGYCGTMSTSLTFRPLVCLKSEVHLIEKNNGTTTTYELELD